MFLFPISYLKAFGADSKSNCLCQSDSWNKILMDSVSHNFNLVSFAIQHIFDIKTWLNCVTKLIICG